LKVIGTMVRSRREKLKEKKRNRKGPAGGRHTAWREEINMTGKGTTGLIPVLGRDAVRQEEKE